MTTSSADAGIFAGLGPIFKQQSLQRVVRTALLAIVAVLVAVPLIILLDTSVSPKGQLPFQSLSFTFDHFLDAFGRPGTGTLIYNTLVYAGGSVLFGGALAVTIAWLAERTDMPGSAAVRMLMFPWMVVPPLVFGYGWILLVNPGNGALNVALMKLFGLSSPPLTPYSMSALILISGLNLVPTCFVMISGLLRNMDPLLEDAGSVLGASRQKIIGRITLPLLSPGLLSVGIFLIMGMVQTFDLPLVIGLTARIPVLSTRIFQLASPDNGVPNYGLASAFGVVLLVLAMGLMLVYFRAIRFSERFRVISGSGFRPKRVKLGRWRIGAAAFVSMYFLVMLLPLLILLWTSLFPFYRLPSLDQFASASLASYSRVLGQPNVVRALGNTILLVLLSGTIVMVLGSLISWFSVRSKGTVGRWLDMMSFAPTAIPPIVVAIAMLLAFLSTPLYGAIWVILIGHITIYLAFGARTMHGALIQIHQQLENAAIISGATWATSLRRIVLPLVWPHFLNGWLWVVAHSARDLTFPLILLTSSNVVVASELYLMWEYPDLPGAAALAMMLVVGLMMLVVPIQIYAARRAGELR